MMISHRPLSLAAYGFVDRDSGSVASASFEILERLLARGHRIDFYAIEGFIRPTELLPHPNFRYRPTSLPHVERVWRFIERPSLRRLHAASSLAWSQVSNALFEDVIGREINREHEERPYDVLLTLGLLSPFATPGLLSISWPQGAPNAEWDALEARRDQLIGAGGRRSYLTLKAGYAYKRAVAQSRMGKSDAIVCGSSWSVGNWIALGAEPGRVHAIPYPFDLDRFHPADLPKAPTGIVTFLCLGRIVPRKRIDLLLDAFEIVKREEPGARLLVIGRFAYAKGFGSLVDRMASMSGVEYREHIDRSLVPDLLRSIDAVVQPSENEDIGSSVLEGLACGKPAVLGPTNGTADYVGPSSVVFDTYNAGSVADAMRRVIARLRSDPGRAAAEARAAAEKHLDVDRVVDRLLDVVASTTTRPQ